MYLGNQPALSYTSFAKQDFTTSATTSYTLDNPVANANELALFINFVRQEPTTAYTASGTTLTLTSATSATDDMYCVFLGKAVQTVNPPAGSVGASQITDGSIALAKLSATGTKDATTFLRGDNTFASAGGDNTPAFLAYLSSSQGASNATVTTIVFQTEVFDTNSAYDTSTGIFTVPAGEGGKYVFHFSTRFTNWNYSIVQFGLRVNGTTDKVFIEDGDLDGDNNSFHSSGVVNLSAGDTVKVGIYQDGGGTVTLRSGEHVSYFTGYKLIGV
jgi:hypothetical protein